MRHYLVMLAAVPVIGLAVEAFAATPANVKTWLDATVAQVAEEARPVAGAGGVPVVSVKVESGRRLGTPRIVKSSGSIAVDRAAITAAKKTRLAEYAPSALVERRITFAVPIRSQTVTAAAATSAAK